MPLQLGSFSANFFYFLLFLVCPIAALDKVPAYAVLAIIIPSAALLGGFLSGLDTDIDFFRSFISFGAYVSVLAILFLRVPLSPDDVYQALIIVCATYAALCIYFVFSEPQFSFADVRGIKSGLRDYMSHWPQRFPILVVVALLYLVFKQNFRLARLIPVFLLAACVTFTYTRAIYLAFFVGVVAGLLPKVTLLSRARLRSAIYVSIVAVGVVSLALYLDNELTRSIYDGLAGISVEAYEGISRFFSGSIAVDRHGGSESERLFHWVEALALWQEQPLFGTGFAGIYQYSNMGSTHSQYIDTLLRTGIFGLAIYLYMWLLLFFRYLKKAEILSGLVAVFIFGFFHETTKLAYTGLLFVLLISHLKESSRLKARVSV